MAIAEQDKLDIEKLIDEATQLRSREAFSALVEVAYAFGRRRGFTEAGDLAKDMMKAPDPVPENAS